MAEPSESARASRVRTRRNLRLVAVGVLAMCLSGLGAAWLYSSAAGGSSVVGVTRTVYRGQLITDADVGLVWLPSTPGIGTVPGERLAEVIGQTAQTDLVVDSVLSPHSFGAPVVELGTSRLGLRLAPGRLPSTELPPGTPVLLVAVVRDSAEASPGPSVTGRIASTATTLPDGATLIDVSVPQEQAERVARLAAGDQLVVVRQPEGQR